jgi:hypothetical protein
LRVLRKICVAIILAVLISAVTTVEGANPRAGNVTVPVMTALTVKLDEAVNAKTAANGSGFTATIKDPVQVNGVTVIPVNSSAGGLLNKASAGGGELVLNSVFVNGRMYRITTLPVSCSQKMALRAGSVVTFNLVLSLNIAR